MNKLAANGRLPPKPQTSFLQKKLQQQRKFFDSGDYAMNKDKAKQPLPTALSSVTASAAPTLPITQVISTVRDGSSPVVELPLRMREDLGSIPGRLPDGSPAG
ncbi:hypothetical protein Tcan_18736 [Toxocara canis]|uniref:cAMP-regulated phosphoprotein 19 n=1 Tax=Toxocara canis TaxID=6265 RepID=A0A0B2VX76_TOXCA|nr:hypothetical protein Tcan_18736 [Toxocara canis]